MGGLRERKEPCDVTTVQIFRQDDARGGKAPFELWKKCEGKKKKFHVYIRTVLTLHTTVFFNLHAATTAVFGIWNHNTSSRQWMLERRRDEATVGIR